MLNKIKKAVLFMISNPRTALPYLKLLFRRFKLKNSKVIKGGKLYYKYKGKLFPEYLDHGNACEHIKDKAKQYCKGTGIDIGADIWPLECAIQVRNEKEQNAYKLDSFEDGVLDFVFSSHCVEHLEYWEKAIKLWIRKLKRGGVIFLYLPHESMILWHPGEPFGGLAHKWIPRHEILIPFLEQNQIDIIDYDKDKDEYWSFYIIGKKK